jgi:hypothetical protein
MKFFDVRTPFFTPLWRRVLVVGIALGWALVELASGATAWALVFGAAGAWLAYSFFVIWEDPEEKDP